MSESATRGCERGLDETFRRDGFVAVPGLFGEEEMRRISAWTDELGALPEVPGRCMMYFEPSLLRPGERVLYVTYNRRSAGDHRERYYADKRKSFPPDIE